MRLPYFSYKHTVQFRLTSNDLLFFKAYAKVCKEGGRPMIRSIVLNLYMVLGFRRRHGPSDLVMAVYGVKFTLASGITQYSAGKDAWN